MTIVGGAGDDSISLGSGYSGSATNNVIVYNEGDGNDTIYGLDSKTTLQIASGNLKSVTSIQAIRPKS